MAEPQLIRHGLILTETKLETSSFGININTYTNILYAPNTDSDTISVIDGKTNSVVKL